MNKKKISALMLSCMVVGNLAIFDKVTFANENNSEKGKQKSNCIAGDYHEEDDNEIYSTENTPVINGIKVNKRLIDINYSKDESISPKYIVIHDTDNRKAGADAMANRNYFANHPNAKASAHYIVDDDEIVQALEDTWKGWHVGDGNNPNINNSTTIAIELCVNKGNDFDKTVETGIELTKHLMNKYNIPAENVVMHRDASGKTCSRMMIEDRPSLWPYFKSRVSGGNGELEDDGVKPKMQGKVINASALNIRETPSTSGRILYKFNRNQVVNIYEEINGWYKVDYIEDLKKKYGYVSKDYIQVTGQLPDGSGDSGDGNEGDNGESIDKKGKVTGISSKLNVRKGPGTEYGVIGYLTNNEEVHVNYEKDGWYNITFDGSKRGYVSKKYITLNSGGNPVEPPVDPPVDPDLPPTSEDKIGAVKVGSSLNVRSGPGSSYGVIGSLRNNDKVTITKEVNGWYEIKFNGKKGYVSKQYITIIQEGETSKPEPPVDPEIPPVSDKKIGKVRVGSSLNMRSGPGSNYSVVGTLRNNDKVEIIREVNGWYEIIFAGKNGYASKQYITVVNNSTDSGSSSEEKEGTVYGISTSLNVRKGPGTNHQVIGYLLSGSKVNIIGEENGWYKIKFQSGSGQSIGYVSKQYVRV
ncbi:SH3 domain-containing protein [Clostridium sp. B9]|uniref:SH3 domain-containing protein n=1 Tax=Clostridium sp. B9 TaxID=3423224 RepID=UPI003D2EDA7A